MKVAGYVDSPVIYSGVLIPYFKDEIGNLYFQHCDSSNSLDESDDEITGFSNLNPKD